MATIRDIANKLGISPGTVSKGLNGASDISESMRQAVLDTAIELGYKPKNMQYEKKICIMVENMNYESIDQFGYEIISGFERAAARKNYGVTIIPTNLALQTKEQYDTFMLKNHYCGAFLLGFELHDDYVKQLDHTKVPTVLLDNFIADNKNVGYVGTDNYEGIKNAILHLKSLGHKK
jgi:LacI family repressor for deo operon, udp, cdd, tsx, nupC, and nupG